MTWTRRCEVNRATCQQQTGTIQTPGRVEDVLTLIMSYFVTAITGFFNDEVWSICLQLPRFVVFVFFVCLIFYFFFFFFFLLNFSALLRLFLFFYLLFLLLFFLNSYFVHHTHTHRHTHTHTYIYILR